MMRNSLIEKIKKIKLIISDVDGILTDGSLYITSDGGEFKKFTVEDGAACAFAQLAKLPIALISGRYSKATAIRAKEMKIQFCYQGDLNKMDSYKELCKYYNVSPDQVLYIGDGYVDIPVMEISGVSFTVSHAPKLVLDCADHILSRQGGKGVLMESVELVLSVQKKLKNNINKMRKKTYKA